MIEQGLLARAVTARFLMGLCLAWALGACATAETQLIATWNLEHFADGQERGFPESLRGGPKYGTRSDADFQAIAAVIRDELDASIVILNEVNGVSPTQSSELDSLAGYVGESYSYLLTESGGHQRIGILYDRNRVRLERCVEITVPEEKVGGKDIFARDPLACLVTLKNRDRLASNDFILVAVHLASGQRLTKNHDRAMEVLAERIRLEEWFPVEESDILIGGDFNASLYDRDEERFWWTTRVGEHKLYPVAPKEGAFYPPTRLAGVPLRPKSQIDYFLASTALAKHLLEPVARVEEQIPRRMGFQEFRRVMSDHIPVTLKLIVHPDDD